MATLIVLQGPDRGRTFRTQNAAVLLGRDAPEIPLTDHTISRRHCELRPDNGTWVLRDLHSANGTHVNGVRVHQPVRLKHGDQIKLGSTLLVYSGDETIEKLSGPARTRGLVDMDVAANVLDSSILARVPSSEDSVIIAAPETAQAVHAWRVMYQMAEAVGAIPSPEELLERMMDIIFEQVDVDRGFVLMRDKETQEMIPWVVRYRHVRDNKPQPISTSRRIINHVVTQREGVLCTNAMTDERFSEDAESGSIHDYALRSVICVPITAREALLGVIHIDCSTGMHTYTEHQLRLITAIGAMSGLAIENARLVQSRMETERLAAMGETVASLSHSIKNILQGLRSGADIVEMGLARKKLSTVSDGWPIVERNLDRIYNLTMNMLAYSKEREPRLEPTQLNKVVQDAVDLMQGHADARAAVLLTEFQEPFPAIPIDADGIQQVVLNLVANAIDAVESPDGVVTVRTAYDAPAGLAVLTVADNGPGIPEDQLEKVFEPFCSSKGHGGTGLGLPVAKKITCEHRGTIEIESTPDGTTMTVKLPAVHIELASEETHGPVR